MNLTTVPLRRSVAVIALLLCGGLAAAAPAPGFELTDLRGERVSLGALLSRGPVLLVFWTTECVYCYAHIGDLNTLQARHGAQGLQVVGVNIGGEPRQEVALYARENGVRYRLLADPGANLDVAEAYGVPGTPTFVLVDRRGALRYRGHRLAEVEARLAGLLGKSP